MSLPLLALNIAILPPVEVAEQAIRLSAALPPEQSEGLQLDATNRPHLTLMQGYVRADELHAVMDRVSQVLRGRKPFPVNVTGGGKTGSTVSMAIERSPILAELHEELMDALRGYERPGGTRAAFVDADGRVADVLWVTSYRLKESFHAFTPHITLGHGRQAPAIEPFTFETATIAACQLGRHCTCQRVMGAWVLEPPE